MKHAIEAYVSSFSTCSSARCRTLVCFFAGILTFRNNFEAAAKEISIKYPEARIVVLFPYGMVHNEQGTAMTRMLLRQLAEVRYDLTHEQSWRITSCLELIREHAVTAENILFIGHSAGGVIAYRLGAWLDELRETAPVHVFAVGSPKFYLKEIAINDRFTYITGQNRDRVTRLGKWNRWGSSKYRGKPAREIQLNFNPAFQDWQFHARYFLNSRWTDGDELLHSNCEDLISKIHEICPSSEG